MPPAGVARRRRCPATTPDARRETTDQAILDEGRRTTLEQDGCGLRYPADPPTVEEIVAVMRRAREDRHGFRLRALIVVLWRGRPRVQEALALGERDLDPWRGSLLVRIGKGGRRREIGMDTWVWAQLSPWLAARVELPIGPLF
jgi:integrase